MSSLDDIYQLRKSVEENVRQVFEANEFKAFTRQNAPVDFKKFRPRVEIKCQIGRATGRRKVFDNGTMKFDAWMLNLAIQAVTEPNNQDALNILHDEYVGRIRAIVSVLAQASWNDVANFPTLYIAEPFRDSGTEDVLKTSEGIEHSTLSFDGIVCIRNAAWTN